MSKITDLLTKKGENTAIDMSEEELFDLFNHFGCTTKTSMMVTLWDLGFSKNQIATCLLALGILSEKSFRQHVRNTIERVRGS